MQILWSRVGHFSLKDLFNSANLIGVECFFASGEVKGVGKGGETFPKDLYITTLYFRFTEEIRNNSQPRSRRETADDRVDVWNDIVWTKVGV